MGECTLCRALGLALEGHGLGEHQILELDPQHTPSVPMALIGAKTHVPADRKKRARETRSRDIKRLGQFDRHDCACVV